jgi:thioredoxin reductase
MSRSSPGRYAIHEFAKNVYDLAVTDSANQSLPVTHPTTNEWDVATHAGAVNVRYRVYGDRVDGTYAAIDTRSSLVSLAIALGCTLNRRGTVKTGAVCYTNVPRLYVAGDASRDAQFVVVAAAEGVKAACAINKALQLEELKS